MPHADHRDAPTPRPSPRDLLIALLAAGAVTLLAWAQPVSTAAADPGVALLAAQALLHHGTLDLAVFEDDPRLAYDLDTDYRVDARPDGTRRYLNLGVPLSTAPAVWVANRLGWDMLEADREEALGNLLSALACGLVFFLLYRLGRRFLCHPASLSLATVFQLGSPLISTLATGLWNLDLAVPLLLVAITALVDGERAPPPARHGRWLLAAGALALAILCRPSTALVVLALVPYALVRRGSGRQLALAVAALLGPALVAIDRVPWLMPGPVYYAPQRLLGDTPLVHGLPAVLLSPSRGLLIFCPFLLALAVACWCTRRRLAEQPLAWLAACWPVLLVLAVATKSKWWGGHCFGPRLLTETLIPAFLLAALVLAGKPSRGLALAGCALALPAIALHSGQALFHAATWEWNSRPDIDRANELLFDWRHPQWLASDTQLAAREVWLARRRLEPLAPDHEVGPSDRNAVFEGWWPPEGPRRWAAGTTPRVCFRPLGFRADRAHVVRLELAALGDQAIDLTLDGAAVGSVPVAAGPPRTFRVALAAGRLAGSGERCLAFSGLRARRPSDEDPRHLALAFRGLALERLPERDVGFDHDAAFLAGWSVAEEGWRWNDGTSARLALPLEAGAPAPLELVIEAFGLGEQPVSVVAQGVTLGGWQIAATAETHRLLLPPGLHLGRGLLEVTLRFPEAAAPGNGDRRRLALALVRARIAPAHPPR